ncbi:MAG TPA: FliM/FliN family flagellar motor C-terminal domain-containing protein [Ramlibacter sp.]|nr:FliM/FliN family flagellar motor C-terminal domain-containing protein [Ramlibacter sp.]
MTPARQGAGPWLLPQSAQALRAWTAQQHDELANSLGQAFAAWSDAWGLGRPADAVRCGPPRPASLRVQGWLPLRRAEGAAAVAWLQLASHLEDRLADAWFPAPDSGPRGPLANAVLSQARSACIADLAAVLGLQSVANQDASEGGSAPTQPGVDATPHVELAWPWSGAVQAALPGPLGGRIVLAGDAMQTWLRQRGQLRAPRPRSAARSALTAVAGAAASRAVGLRAHLTGCEIPLGALLALRPGDVVRLPHALMSPATLVDDAGRAQLTAWLGRSGARRAVQLAEPSLPDQPPSTPGQAQANP